MKVETARKRNWALRLIKCMRAQLKAIRFFFEETEEFKDNKNNWLGIIYVCESMLRALENQILTELPAKKEKKNGKAPVL